MLISGTFASLVANVAHNFYHRRDNWQMWLFDITLMNSQQWRITHGNSHHMFPNTLMDLEITMFEPFIYWLPINKKSAVLHILFQWILLPLIFCITTLVDGLKVPILADIIFN